jgi:hypothetical protein
MPSFLGSLGELGEGDVKEAVVRARLLHVALGRTAVDQDRIRPSKGLRCSPSLSCLRCCRAWITG